MEKAFDQNRVSRADQLYKLRESLRGQAKRMVPEDITEDIDKAWEALDKAYGDPNRLVNHRKKALVKLGPIPKKNGKGGFQKRVDWYINLEVLLQSILELGQKSEDLNSEVFIKKTFKDIC